MNYDIKETIYERIEYIDIKLNDIERQMELAEHNRHCSEDEIQSILNELSVERQWLSNKRDYLQNKLDSIGMIL